MNNFWLKEIIFCLLVIQVTKTACRKSLGNIAGLWKIKYFLPDDIPRLLVGTNVEDNLTLEIYDVENNATQTNSTFFEFATENKKIATVDKRVYLSDMNGTTWRGVVPVKGHSFGYTQLFLTLNDPQTNRVERSDQEVEVAVVRKERVAISIFNYSAVFIMLLMFVNLGTVLDLERIRMIFIRPIGPLLGFSCRYMLMPGLAIGLGALIFPNKTNLQLALLFTAISPSGGIANICNVFLKGNINLSLAATTVNSILALGMLPFWINLMGPILHRNSEFNLPFVDIAVGCFALIFALTLGILLRTFIPNTTRCIFRFLKPVSVFLSLCLVAVTVGINAFAFKEVTPMIFLAALLLPGAGYTISFGLSKLLCCSVTDAMTIAIETGAINMSLPIVLLEYSIEQPLADMLVVVPILSALISLCLVVMFYIIRRIFGWNTKRDLDSFDDEKFLVE